MRRKKFLKKLTYWAPVILIAASAAFLVFKHYVPSKQSLLSSSGKPAVGYKDEDRQKLEKLIHTGTEND